MSTSPQTNPNDQEIDLGLLSKKIGDAIQSFIDWIFDGILFIRRNIIVLLILLIGGAVLGYFIDKNNRVYDHQIIVSPNFGSINYLYSKVDLISSKIKERDTVFLKSIGIKNPKKVLTIKIEPIVDVFKFVEGNEKNFELLKLMAEDSDLGKIAENDLISRNYTYHLISYTTSELTSLDKTFEPLMSFFNDSEYYKTIQKGYLNNLNLKMSENLHTISQINGILDQFSNSTSNTTHRNDKLVYYNENTQLNEVIKTKEELIKEQGLIRLDLFNSSKIINDNSKTLNIKNTKAVNGKMKLILPILFVGLFISFGLLIRFYRRQLAKRNLA
ncbi:hypothetical protein [Flavobacterium sp.]|uniref:hypothetical protein n=1 Tax=Flavobacterium sp. TaxID=239 RepID=UPI0028BD685A|nr:hypothetical protein [Flavobacterium sp.]